MYRNDDETVTQPCLIVQDGYTAANDGSPLHYQSVGCGLPLIACNGLACTNTFWSMMADHFATKLQFITWDYKGHGLSALPNDWSRLKVADMAEDAARVLDRLGIEKAVLTGHSMGVQVILEFWHLFPDRVMALIPVCGAYEHPFNQLLHSGMMNYLFPPMYVSSYCFPWWTGKMQYWFTRPMIARYVSWVIGINRYLMPDERMVHYLDHMGRLHPKVFVMAARALQEHSAASYLRDIQVPTLVVAGEKDDFTPLWLNLKMHEAIADSTLLTIPEGRHVAHMEMPKLAHQTMERFLSEHFPEHLERSTGISSEEHYSHLAM